MSRCAPGRPPCGSEADGSGSASLVRMIWSPMGEVRPSRVPGPGWCSRLPGGDPLDVGTLVGARGGALDPSGEKRARRPADGWKGLVCASLEGRAVRGAVVSSSPVFTWLLVGGARRLQRSPWASASSDARVDFLRGAIRGRARFLPSMRRSADPHPCRKAGVSTPGVVRPRRRRGAEREAGHPVRRAPEAAARGGGALLLRPVRAADPRGGHLRAHAPGTGASARIVRTTSCALTPRMRASGLRISRWARMCGARTRMSSGTTKLRPFMAA